MRPEPGAPFAREWALQENILSIVWNRSGSGAAVGLVDGSVSLVGEGERVTAHKGGLLALTQGPDDGSFLSSGDDGRVVKVTPDGALQEVAAHKGAWIDQLASHDSGLVAYAVGKEVIFKGEKLPHPSTVGGLAFAPNGKRLAASHYNGVSLWWTNAKDKTPQTLLWKGSHLALAWHPNGEVLMSNMQDNALHGWRLKELGKPSGELRMAGYPGKIPAMAFSARGTWLVTAGTEQVICWPFFGGGPSGKPPLALGMPEASVSMIAPHPSDDMCAAGYSSGRVILALYDDRLPIEILRPEGSPITALAWNPSGDQLLVGREDGRLYLYTSASIIAASQNAP